MSGVSPERCVTCSDEALRGTVLALDGDEALVELPDGVEARVALDLVPDTAVGDVLLCHVGIALERLDPHGAADGAHA